MGWIVVGACNRVVNLHKTLTGPVRTLPEVFVIGAQKAGTTTVWSYLITHPDVFRNDPKEPHFFDDYYGRRSVDWYRGHYPWRPQAWLHRRRHGHRLVSLDASPSYLFHPHAPRRLAAAVPDARLIAVLREPVARAYSHHQHSLRRGMESLDFPTAVDAEPERTAGELERMLEDDGYYSIRRGEYSYLGRGEYADQLHRWLEHFDREQLLVLTLDELSADPRGAYARLRAHCGLRDVETRKVFESNRGGYDDTMDPDLRDRLRAHFGPHDERLADLLGTPLPWREGQPNPPGS